jgi:hypothetical protein
LVRHPYQGTSLPARCFSVRRRLNLVGHRPCP